jgi:hypothetical protein
VLNNITALLEARDSPLQAREFPRSAGREESDEKTLMDH